MNIACRLILVNPAPVKDKINPGLGPGEFIYPAVIRLRTVAGKHQPRPVAGLFMFTARNAVGKIVKQSEHDHFGFQSVRPEPVAHRRRVNNNDRRTIEARNLLFDSQPLASETAEVMYYCHHLGSAFQCTGNNKIIIFFQRILHHNHIALVETQNPEHLTEKSRKIRFNRIFASILPQAEIPVAQ